MSSKVLIVDDGEDFLEYTKKRLINRGLEVWTALDGIEAIKTIEQNDFDVVVLDVLMPNMDGIETLQRIKEIKPGLPVIMLSGHGAVESAAEGLKLGAVEYLLKPCDFETLLSSIENAKNKATTSSD